MIEKELGRSGYKINNYSLEDGGVFRITFHTESVYVALMLDPQEMNDFIISLVDTVRHRANE